VLKRCWYDVFILNAYAPTRDKSDDAQKSVCEEPEQAFDKFCEHIMKNCVGCSDFK